MPEESPYNEFVDQSNQRHAVLQVDDIITRPPTKLIRSGITMTASATMILIVMSWFIQYPDIIEAPFVISAVDAPVEHFPQIQGYIQQQFLYDGSKCFIGDTIFYLNNPASIHDARIWREYLDTLQSLHSMAELISITVPERLVLGDMQNSFRLLVEAVKNAMILYGQTITAQREAQIEKEIEVTQLLNQSQIHQASLFQKELEIANKETERASFLYDKRVISLADLEQTHKAMASTERTYEGIRSSTLQNDVRVAQLESSKYEIRAARVEQLTNALLEIRQAINSAEVAYEAWYDKYFIVALMNGVIVIPESIRRYTLVNPQEPIVTILSDPIDASPYAVAMLQGNRTGKIEVKQKAIIRFDEWPYREYGSVESVVKYKSSLPVINGEGESFYETHLTIPFPVISTYGKTLKINQRSTGIARIISEERSMLERIFSGILSILQNQ